MSSQGGQSRIRGLTLVDDDEFAGNLITLKDGFDGREQEFRPVARWDDEGGCGQACLSGRTGPLFCHDIDRVGHRYLVTLLLDDPKSRTTVVNLHPRITSSSAA